MPNQGETVRVHVNKELYEEIKVVKVNSEKEISTICKIVFRRIVYKHRDLLDKHK